MKSNSIVDTIVEKKRERLIERKQHLSPQRLASYAEQNNRTYTSLSKSLKEAPQMGVLAEIKKASPSKGLIREDFDPEAIAMAYQNSGGVQGISILTEEDFFLGSDQYIQTLREQISLPILRKDFTVDPYQIDEAQLMGADAILLIAAILEDEELQSLRQYARKRNLEVLAEIHNPEELERVLAMQDQPELIGVNNRNLRTFEEDLSLTERLLAQIPANVCRLSESAIRSREDYLRAEAAGADAVLVGEYFMRQDDIEAAVHMLLGETSES